LVDAASTMRVRMRMRMRMRIRDRELGTWRRGGLALAAGSTLRAALGR
jgi:hypothetical protein